MQYNDTQNTVQHFIKSYVYFENHLLGNINHFGHP